MKQTRRSSPCSVEPLEDRKLLSAAIKVVGNGQRITPGDRTASRDDFTDYGPMALAGPITQAGRTYTIKNSGDTAMTLTGARVSISGEHANQFVVAKKPVGTIAAGGGSTFRIKFDPTSAGVKYATVTVTSISNKSVYKFNIAARGVETTNRGVNLETATLKSGSGTVAPAGAVLRVKYNGFRADGFVFDPGTAPYSFALGNDSVIEGWHQGLVGSKVGEKRVLFVPSALAYGEDGSGTSIPSNTPIIFETTILGVGPSLNVTGKGQTIADGDSSPSTNDDTNFGSVARNSTVVKTFTVAADIFSQTASVYPDFTDATTPIHVSGANASKFTASGLTSNGNGTVSFTVTFRPTAAGTQTATIEIPNTNPIDNLYTFTIQGVGT